jgi:hypothetical protein
MDNYSNRNNKRKLSAHNQQIPFKDKAKQREGWRIRKRRSRIKHLTPPQRALVAEKIVNALMVMPQAEAIALTVRAGLPDPMEQRMPPLPLPSYPQLTPEQTANLMLDVGLSTTQMDTLRRHMKGLLASRDKTRAVLDEMGPKAVERRYTLSDGRVLHYASVSLIDSVTYDAQHWNELKSITHHRIKIGGDGSTDLRDKNDKTRTISMLCYAHMDIPLANSYTHHGVLAAGWCKEDHPTVYGMAQHVVHEMEHLRTKGIIIDGIQHTFEFNLFGDMKWLRLALGLKSSSATYCCIYCFITTDVMQRGYSGETKWDMYDTHLKDMDNKSITPNDIEALPIGSGRSLIHMQTAAAKGYDYGQKCNPAFLINTWDCPVEELHMILRIMSRYESIWCAMHDSIHNIPIHETEIKAFHNEHYSKHLSSMHISRGISGLTGENCQKILRSLDTYLKPLQLHTHYDALRSSMSTFDKLVNNKYATAEVWRDDARAYAIHASSHFGEYMNSSCYLHVMACHGWRWFPIKQFSSYGMEKLNHQIKVSKGLIQRDMLSHEDAICNGGGALCRMLDRVNVTANCKPAPKRTYKCKGCGGNGHTIKTCGTTLKDRLRTVVTHVPLTNVNIAIDGMMQLSKPNVTTKTRDERKQMKQARKARAKKVPPATSSSSLSSLSSTPSSVSSVSSSSSSSSIIPYQSDEKTCASSSSSISASSLSSSSINKRVRTPSAKFVRSLQQY